MSRISKHKSKIQARRAAGGGGGGYNRIRDEEYYDEDFSEEGYTVDMNMLRETE